MLIFRLIRHRIISIRKMIMPPHVRTKHLVIYYLWIVSKSILYSLTSGKVNNKFKIFLSNLYPSNNFLFIKYKPKIVCYMLNNFFYTYKPIVFYFLWFQFSKVFWISIIISKLLCNINFSNIFTTRFGSILFNYFKILLILDFQVF